VSYVPGIPLSAMTREGVSTLHSYREGRPVEVPRQWFTRLEACAYLEISPSKLLRLRKDKQITGYSGIKGRKGSLCYKRADLDALLEPVPVPYETVDQDPIPGLEGWSAPVLEHGARLVRQYAERGLVQRYADLGAQTFDTDQNKIDNRDVRAPDLEPIPEDVLRTALENASRAKRKVVVFGVQDLCPICPDGGGQTHEHRTIDVEAALNPAHTRFCDGSCKMFPHTNCPSEYGFSQPGPAVRMGPYVDSDDLQGAVELPDWYEQAAEDATWD
jgi:hypothetical protein